MDYKEVRKRNRIKRKGGTTVGREIKAPERVDYRLRRNIIILGVLMLISLVLGIMLVILNTDIPGAV